MAAGIETGMVSKWLLVFGEWLKDMGLKPEHVPYLAYGALGLVVLSVITRLLFGRRDRGPSERRLIEKLNELEVQVADLKSRLGRSEEQYRDDIEAIRYALTDLRRDSFEAGVTEAEPKKKTTDLVTESVEADVIPPAQLSAEPLQPDITSSLPRRGLSGGLEKSRTHFFSRLSGLFGGNAKALTSEFLDELEMLLISSDLGVKTTGQVLELLRIRAAEERGIDENTLRKLLKDELVRILEWVGERDIVPVKVNGQPKVVLFVGVNGVGKTTTVAKLGKKFSDAGAKVILGACDTFRAAATEQLSYWGERIGVSVVSGEDGTKPSTVAYQTIHRGLEEGADVALIDTAGRLHTRVNLMNELKSVCSIIDREQPGAPHEVILVVDATTGQNALTQAREFNQIAKLTGVIVTKLDGTPKGGIVVAIKEELGIPVRYIGIGEGEDDLQVFSPVEFVDALLEEGVSVTASAETFRGQARRRRREETPSVSNGS